MLSLRLLGSALALAGVIKAQVDLGTALSFAVLGGSAVTNTGPSIISGNVGVYPGSAISGFPPGTVVNGVIHMTDAVAAQAQADVTTAYNVAAGLPPNVDLTGQDLGGMTLVAGVYSFSTSAQLTGALVLDGQGDSSSVWVFQIGTTLTTATASSVILIGGASPCNVFWQVGSSATIGTTTTFVGNVLALTSITLVTGASNNGGLYARNGAKRFENCNAHCYKRYKHRNIQHSDVRCSRHNSERQAKQDTSYQIKDGHHYSNQSPTTITSYGQNFFIETPCTTVLTATVSAAFKKPAPCKGCGTPTAGDGGQTKSSSKLWPTHSHEAAPASQVDEAASDSMAHSQWNVSLVSTPAVSGSQAIVTAGVSMNWPNLAVVAAAGLFLIAMNNLL
ncbi:hypothetical protein J3F83DRAFT_769863 [Trichoderma novae-zelandiae]